MQKPPIPPPTAYLKSAPEPTPDLDPPRVFKMSLWKMFAVGGGLGAVGLVMRGFLEYGRNISWLGLIIGLLGGEICGFVLTVIGIHYFKTIVDEQGIRGLDAWSRRCNLAWSEIVSVSPINILGFKYVRLLSDSKPPLWLPLSFSDKVGLRAAVLKRAGANNPLKLWFEQHPVL